MKRLFILLLVLIANISLFAQIENVFYIRLGTALPIGSFGSDQDFSNEGYYHGYYRFPKAKVGFNFGLGSHFYTGKAFANEKIRIGIDATYFSSAVHSASYDSVNNYHDPKNFYWILKQKFGPIITFSPSEDIFLDFGIRIVPTIGYLFGDNCEDIWGGRINGRDPFQFQVEITDSFTTV